MATRSSKLQLTPRHSPATGMQPTSQLTPSERSGRSATASSSHPSMNRRHTAVARRQDEPTPPEPVRGTICALMEGTTSPARIWARRQHRQGGWFIMS
eukprot:scaffold127821_cov35-Tisochrysis_lutea.AAC.1